MAYKMKGFSGFGNSPAKQGSPRKEYPPGLTKEQKKIYDEMTKPRPGKTTSSPPDEIHGKEPEGMLTDDGYRKSSQQEGNELMRDYDEWKKKSDKRKGRNKSPLNQKGPISKKNIKLQKGEMEGTWIYPGSDKGERITDYEDRAEFARSDAESSEGKEKKQHLANAKKFQHEADIIRNRKPDKKKK
jgi:hypothetical protein